MEKPTAEARSIAWMLGGRVPAEPLQLAALDGAAVTLRSVTADDQERWRDMRKSRMMGYGALGDQGDRRDRSYVHLPIPEWLLDCCTACVEVSRVAELPPNELARDELRKAGFAATDANQLHLASAAVVDLIRLVVAQSQLQGPVTELIVVATQGRYGQKNHAWFTQGFLWRHAQQRWELSAPQATMLGEWWRSYTSGPNAELMRWPLRRFGVAMHRSFTEDRLVDLAIALEAIFMREDDPQRGTRGFIAERANRLLDGDRSVRKLRSNRILDAYKIRSDIVHGRMPSEDDVERASADMETVMREALQAIFSATIQLDPAAPTTPNRPGIG